jgi:hypothetical protein
VEFFSLTGGEPLLYKHLGKLIQYIHENYRNKIGRLGLATNSTIMPSDNLCKIIRDCNVDIICDDYSDFEPKHKKRTQQVTEKLDSFGIQYKSGKNIRFFKTFPPSKDFREWPNDALCEKFEACKKTYSGFGLKMGNLFSCCYSMFADTAKLVPAQHGDYYKLFENIDKYELVKFILGYTNCGYTEFCKYCNCFFGTQSGYDENGVTQQPKDELLVWDINRPTFLE